MLKAVFFDFFNTLVYFDPPREKHFADCAAMCGVNVSPEAVAAALPDADAWWRSENLRSAISQRDQESKFEAYRGYGLRILRDAAGSVTPEQALNMLAKAFSIGFNFRNYPDSLPTLQGIQERGLPMGLISNIGEDIDSYLNKAGFDGFFQYKVTSFEAGYDKPNPEIFLLALQKAGVKADEALYVGDQYDQDVIGARAAGIKPILIDRDGASQKRDCVVIGSLLNVADYL